MSCPRCDHVHCVKNGKVEGKKRYKCKSCGFQFTRLTPRIGTKTHACQDLVERRQRGSWGPPTTMHK